MSPRDVRAALFKQRLAAVEDARKAVAEAYGLTVADLKGRSKVPPVPEARREVMTRLWELGLSLSEIGRLLGHDPSTVHTAVKKSMGDTYAELSAGPGKVRKIQDIQRSEAK